MTRAVGPQHQHGRDQPLLQVALLVVPILAGLIGLFNSFRMMRLREIEPRAAIEGATLG